MWGSFGPTSILSMFHTSSCSVGYGKNLLTVMWGRYALHHGYPEPPTAPLNSKWKMGMDTIIGIVYGHSTILWWVRIGAGVMVSVWMELCLPQIFFVKICKNLSRISACQEFFLRANYHIIYLPYVCSWAATTRHFVVLRRVWFSLIKYINFTAYPLLALKCRVGALKSSLQHMLFKVLTKGMLLQ